MSAAGSILVIDDRLGSAAALASWLQGCGRPIAISATYAEAAATISYHQLAGTGVPALVVGPLQRDGVAFLADLRDQRVDISAAFYTEAKSRDQDDALARQYGLTAILHKPFEREDRSRLDAALSGSQAGKPATATRPAPSEPLVSSRAIVREELANVADGHAPAPSLDEILGTGRTSSVTSGTTAAPRRELSPAELPSGVQRLLLDPMSATVGATKSEAAPVEAVARAIAMIVVDDRFGSARLLVERLGMPGQTLKSVATWQEALEQIDRLMVGNLGCELLFGPLTAEGVHLVKELRRRSLPTHVVFYTESATQSQDPRLREQYGCLAIVRRSGMIEPIEKIITDIRSSPRHAPQAPGEPASLTRASSGRMQAVAPPTPPAAPPAPSRAAAPTPTRPSDQHRPSGIFPPETATSTAPSQRLRRSLATPPRAPAPAQAPGQSPLQIDIPGDTAPTGHDRVITCRKCAHEFVASIDRVPCTVTCGKCGTVIPIGRV